MAIATSYLCRGRIDTITQAVMPSLRAVLQAILVVCVLDATGELFYPNLSRHSLALYLCRLCSVLFGFLLVKAVQRRKTTV